MRGRWVGPFPIREFLSLLPGQEYYLAPPHDIFDKLQLEKCDHLPLINVLKSLNLENLQFIDTSDSSDDKPPPHKRWLPTISAYSSGFKPEGHQRGPTYSGTPGKGPYTSLLLSFELERGEHDPFSDEHGGPDARFESAHSKIQGRIAAILNQMLSYSFRTHAFLIFMNGRIARLFRADRAGVLVSEAFCYRTDTPYLTEFLRRFDNMTPGQWGIDITADYNLGIIQVPTTSHSLRVELEGDLPHTHSLVGRGRRVVRAYDQNSKQYCFVKDGWRSGMPGMAVEWDVVAELKEKGVPHIPAILFGGDVSGEYHHTLADKYADSEWRVGRETELVPRVHYRFVEEDVGKPLEEFKHAKELTCALSDVTETLQAAWNTCRYLHRDVSSANILITPSGRGVLINWEFAKRYPDGEEPQSRISGRTGTRAYMSAALLIIEGKPHSLLDDIQSVYWVGFEKSLNNLEHNYTNKLLRAARCLVEYDPRTDGCGDTKTSFLLQHPRIEFVGNPAFSSLMQNFCRMMCSGLTWEFELEDPTMAGPQPPEVPNHDSVLQIFREALSRPDDQWSLEPYDNKNQIWRALETASAW